MSRSSPLETMRQLAIHVNEAYVLWRMQPTEENKNILGASLWVYCAGLLGKDFQIASESNRRQERTIKREGGEMYLSANDLVQDACLKIWEDLPNFNGNSSFATWARKVINTTTAKTLQRTHKDFDEEIVETGFDSHPYVSFNKHLDLQRFRESLSEDDDLFLHLKLEGYTEVELGKYFNESAEWAHHKYRQIVKDLTKFSKKNAK